MAAVTTTIASFPTTPISATDGTEPDGQLFIDSNGNLRGATVVGGANSSGTTYEIVNNGGVFATTPTFLADIPTGLNTLVGVPNLSADANGDLFGLMFSGGTTNHLGTVVKFAAAGGAASTVATFTPTTGASNPGGVLLVDASGNLFGTTLSGGAHGSGTVFEVKAGTSTPIVLTSFSSGIVPSGSGNLVEDAAGDLFGTTTNSVFEVKKSGASYATPVDLVPFPVGTQIGSLTIDSKGNIFGTTISGGANDDGTVFEIEKTATGYAGTPTTLASFVPADGQLSLNRPKILIVDANGDLFGTTDPSAQNSGGVVYEIVRTSTGYDSTPVIVSDFNGKATGSLGANVVADANGNLFGTTQAGGASNKGTAFEITGSGYATTPTVVPIIPNLVWQNDNGQASVWAMDGTTWIGGGLVSLNPGPTWRAVGTGTFFAGDTADLLWQNRSTGQAAVWEMDGNTRLSGGVVSLDPGPTWKAIGTGDFNGDHLSDILWQNTSTGQAAVWNMDGTTRLGGGVVSLNPGTSWKAVGTGDFYHDGHAGILWQNPGTGQVAIWDMDGNTRLGGGVVSLNPGPAWHAIGSGDFYGNGLSDILFQNASTGQVAVWEMDGTTRLAGGVVSLNPGTSWHAIGTGAGGSEILFQNTSGQSAIWQMDGTTRLGGAAITPNPGTAWHTIGLS